MVLISSSILFSIMIFGLSNFASNALNILFAISSLEYGLNVALGVITSLAYGKSEQSTNVFNWLASTNGNPKVSISDGKTKVLVLFKTSIILSLETSPILMIIIFVPSKL